MFPSYEYIPEVREEEERVVRNDPFRRGRRPRRTIVRGVRRTRYGVDTDDAHTLWVAGSGGGTCASTDEIPARGLSPWNAGNWASNARLPK